MEMKTRIPKPKDIGLIFEITLMNAAELKQELLKYRIRSAGYCCVNVIPGVVREKINGIIGGNYGFIEPGAIDKVYLIWPTVYLFNRVGICPITITFTNIKNQESTFKHFIKFDTRYETLNPRVEKFIKDNDYAKIQNPDKLDLKNYTSINCEERYFASRNFYNISSDRCEKVTRCFSKYKLYDIFTKECVDLRVICFQNGQKEQNSLENQTHFLSFNFLKHSELNKTEKWFHSDTTKIPSWLRGLGGSLLIVFATITIYLLICFGLFLIVICLTKRTKEDAGKKSGGIILTPHYWGSSEENLPLYTTSSLMSQR